MNTMSIIISAKNTAKAVFDDLIKDITDVRVPVDKLNTSFEKFTGIATSFVASGAKMALTGGVITGALGLAVNQAAAFNEQQEKFQNILGKSGLDAERYARVLVDSFGMSEVAAKSFLSQVGLFLSAQGVEGVGIARLSNEFVKLASDLGAYTKQDTTQILQSMQMAFIGNYRSLRQLGIAITEADVKQKAYTLGLIKSGEALNATAKASSLLTLITQKLPQAIGATQDNFNSLQDQLERMRGRFNDLVINIGKSVVPTFETVIQKVEPFVNLILRFSRENQGLVKTLTLTVIGLGALLTTLGSISSVIGLVVLQVIALQRAHALWNASLIATRIQLLLLPLEEMRAKSLLFAGTLNTVMIAAVGALTYSLYQAVEAWIEYAKAAQEAEYAQSQFKLATAATTADVIKFNKETKNQANTIQDVARLAREQGLILNNSTGKWEGMNKKVGEQENKVSLLGTAYTKLQGIIVSTMDASKRKVQELDESIKKSEFQKLEVTEKFAKIRNDISREALAETGDTLAVWKNKFDEATKASNDAASLIRKASTTMDAIVKEELVKLAQAKIADATSIATGLTGAVEKTNLTGNTEVLQTAEQSRTSVLSLISSLEGLSQKIVDTNKKSLESEKTTIEGSIKVLEEKLKLIPQKLDPKVTFQIDKTSYDETVALLEKLTKDKTIRIQIQNTSQPQETPEGFNSGGSLPGYGGGDKISALLEAGEFVMRKEAVRKFGAGFFYALNSMQIPELLKAKLGGYIQGYSLPEFKVPQMAFASGGQVPSMKHFGTVDLNVGNRIFPVMGNSDVIEQLKQTLTKEKLTRST